uniref:Uncharacterized protein n=1 Tax=Caenorhabditis japonica TaxID=281687 RepID=A0A8R1IEB4_CAEJA
MHAKFFVRLERVISVLYREIQTIGSLLVADAQSMFPRGSRNKKNHYPIITLQGSDGSKTTVANKHGETVSILFK